MRLERARDPAGPIVLGIGPAGFRTGDGVFGALLMTAEAIADWTPPALADLSADDLAAILAPVPEFLLLGTGATVTRAPRALIAALDAQAIGIEAMDSRAAARAWGVLRGEGRRIAAALYPIA